MGLNLDYLVDCIWEKLELVRVYTKKRGGTLQAPVNVKNTITHIPPPRFLFFFSEPPDFGDALIMRAGATVESICRTVHRDLVKEFRYANVWVRRYRAIRK
jgi:ribosome-interacting GTPase 1